MLAPEIETRPWAEQLAIDDAAYREQLAYVFDRSTFYRETLTAAGFASAGAAGGLAEIAALPLTEKQEIRASCTPDTYRSPGTAFRTGRSRESSSRSVVLSTEVPMTAGSPSTRWTATSPATSEDP